MKQPPPDSGVCHQQGGALGRYAENVKEASSKLVRGDVDVALCDIMMPDGNGVELVRSFRGAGIDTQFVMVTGLCLHGNGGRGVAAGATDYMVKPIRTEELLHRLEQIASMRGLRAENQALRQMVSPERGVFHFSSRSMIDMERLVSKVAVTDSTVLITGESGTGKGVTARNIHEMSPRSEFPFIPVNCGAIPENLLESEFFGHSKGAFTGADRARKGLFTQADRGTLFLDEIGELPLLCRPSCCTSSRQGSAPLGGDMCAGWIRGSLPRDHRNLRRW